MNDVLNEAAFNLHRAVAQISSTKNVALSPISITCVLGLLHQGAGGETKRQVAEVFRWTDVADEVVCDAFKTAIGVIASTGGSDVEVALINKMWIGSMNARPSYQELARTFFSSELETIDLSVGAEAADAINRWVREGTHGKIPNIISSSDLGPFVVSVITNVAYFKGFWAKKFDPARTSPRPFHLEDGTHVQRSFMCQKSYFHYHEDQARQCQILDLQYAGAAYGMMVVLPTGGVLLSTVEGQMSNSLFAEWSKSLRSVETNVQIPKFSIEVSVDLRSTLMSLGLVDLFEPSTCCLVNMTADEGIYISKAVHKVRIDVDEEGTVAAAATAACINRRCLVAAVNFLADRPFLVYVYHKPSSTILFCASVYDPVA